MGDGGFNKTDMERIGIFKEMGYISIKDPYKGKMMRNFNEAAGKGKQMLPGGSKDRSAKQDGYFAEKFDRVMEGEAYTDPVRMRRQMRLKENQGMLGKAFIPNNGYKEMNGLGTYYGTISGALPAFSPAPKTRPPYKAPGKNFYTNPGKKGVGGAYTGVTIGKSHTYMTDEFDRARADRKKENERHKQLMKGSPFLLGLHPQPCFNANPFRNDKPLPPPKKQSSPPKDIKPFKVSSPSKRDGGCKAGTFDPYPTHSVDPYVSKLKQRPVNVVNKSGKIFEPNQGPKSTPVTSVVNQNVIRSMNIQNFKSVTTVMGY